MNQNRNTNSERGSRNTEPSLPSRSWRPPIAQPIRKRHERRRFDMMNQAAPNRKCLHRHQILQHARRRIRRRAATSAVVHEQRECPDGLLLLVEDEGTTRPNVLHVGKDRSWIATGHLRRRRFARRRGIDLLRSSASTLSLIHI